MLQQAQNWPLWLKLFLKKKLFKKLQFGKSLSQQKNDLKIVNGTRQGKHLNFDFFEKEKSI